MADVFSFNNVAARQPGGAWQISGAVLTFSDTALQGPATAQGQSAAISSTVNRSLIAVGCTLDYQRGLTPVTPINLAETFMVVGQPVGQMSIEALIGPNTDIQTFLQEYGDACKFAKNAIQVDVAGITGCDSQGNPLPGAVTKGWTLRGVLLASLGVSVREIGQGNLSASSTLKLSFMNMEWK